MPTPLPVLDCRNCGVCCLHMGYPAFNFPESEQLADEIETVDSSVQFDKLTVADRDRTRWLALPQELKLEIQNAIKNRRTAAGDLDPPCIWLDPETKFCRNHEYRPQVCRDFSVGGKRCLEWRASYRVDG